MFRFDDAIMHVLWTSINTRLQLSDNSSIPPIQGDFLLWAHVSHKHINVLHYSQPNKTTHRQSMRLSYVTYRIIGFNKSHSTLVHILG